MKLIANLLIAILIPILAFADPVVRNESQTTLYSTDGQVGPHVSVDRFGNQLIISSLSAPGSTWQACTGAITDTTQTAIKAAVALNRIYITEIGCNNSSAVASTLVFQDGAATAIWQGAITAAATNGSYTMTFPVPLRGTVNTALNVTLGTTATNTRCCAAGYISVN